MAFMNVINPGMYTTIQDLGRTGFQQYGMPLSGSMDAFAHRVANLLVGNDEEEAVLEMTILGGTFVFEQDVIIAITGADMNPMRSDNTEVGMWRTVVIRKGEKLQFGASRSGCRCYMAIAGGFKVPEVMGSKSTYVRGHLGGYEGRPLKKDDQLRICDLLPDVGSLKGRFVKAACIPEYGTELELRVILGPQDDAFTRQGIADFFSTTYKVSNEFDRMGYRLEGKKVKHVESADIISDGIVKGAVQIPGHGNPIIMLADCQTTGGYTKMAHVISADLPKIAQAKAGDQIRFRAVNIQEAHEILRQQEAIFEDIKEDFSRKKLDEDKNLKLKINNQAFTVKINEIKSV